MLRKERKTASIKQWLIFFPDFPRSDKPVVLNKKSLESLIKAGSFDKLASRKELLGQLESLLEFAREAQKTRQYGQTSLFGSEAPTNNHFLFSNNHNNQKLESDEIQWEKELLGMYISDHPLSSHKNLFKKRSYSD